MEKSRRGNKGRRRSDTIDQTLARQAEVSRLFYRRVPSREIKVKIAADFGVLENRVEKDLSLVRTQARADFEEAKKFYIHSDLATLSALEAQLDADLACDISPAVRAQVAAAKLKVHDRRAKLLGYDSPEKHEHKVALGSPDDNGKLGPIKIKIVWPDGEKQPEKPAPGEPTT
jgi:hypothetical protein